jgi:hypothetical protein
MRWLVRDTGRLGSRNERSSIDAGIAAAKTA